jgi:signal transduction histidine kinase
MVQKHSFAAGRSQQHARSDRRRSSALQKGRRIPAVRARSALDSAEAASRAKTRFLASASHDLRQPIQTISLFAAALALRPLDERSRAIASNMNEAVRDLSVELDALLDVSKLDAGLVQSQPVRLQLRSFLKRVRAIFAVPAREKRIGLTTDCADDLWICTDRNLLERIVRNLVENAVKYTDAGHVRIVASQDKSAVSLFVEDSGCGIDSAELPRIFEEFYQIQNPERDRRRGLGLGLAIVRRLTTMLQIPMRFTSAIGVGTRVSRAAGGGAGGSGGGGASRCPNRRRNAARARRGRRGRCQARHAGAARGTGMFDRRGCQYHRSGRRRATDPPGYRAERFPLARL